MTQPKTQPLSVSAADRPLVYVNGEIVPKSQAQVNVYDHGLLYGDGVFEGLRVYGGRIFKLEQHMDRLWRSAEAIRLKIPVSREEMIDIQRRTVEANGIVDGYIRLVVTRGVGTLGLDPRRCVTPGIICIADQIALYSDEQYRNGMRIIVASRPRIPTECLDPRIKSLNYLNNIMAKCEAIDFGVDECIMLNTDGWVAEASADNIFIVKDGIVYTPSPEAGFLQGITRQVVMEDLSRRTGIRVVEKMMRLPEVFDADEVFLTGSAAEIIAVTQIDEQDGTRVTAEHRISDGEGPVTRRLRESFRELVADGNAPEA